MAFGFGFRWLLTCLVHLCSLGVLRRLPPSWISRNVNAFTNQSVHNRVDNQVLNYASGGDYSASAASGPSGDAYYAPPQEQLERVAAKFNVAAEVYRETGDSRTRDYMSDLSDIARNELNGDGRQWRVPN
jgi:hypothetical protein